MPGSLYEQDFFVWTQKTAELIRKGLWSEADAPHIAEELEHLGSVELNGVRESARSLLVHLLNWEAAPLRRDSSAPQKCIGEQSAAVRNTAREPKSAKQTRAGIAGYHHEAVHRAALDTRFPIDRFPQDLQYTFEELLLSTNSPK